MFGDVNTLNKVIRVIDVIQIDDLSSFFVTNFKEKGGKISIQTFKTDLINKIAVSK